MNVIMLSSDPTITSKNSRAYNRVKRYSERLENLFVFVTSKKDSKIKKIKDDNLSIHFVGGLAVFRYIKLFFKAMSIAIKYRKRDCIITSQDPFYLGSVAIKISKILSVPTEIQVHTDLNSVTKGFLNTHKMIMAKVNLKLADRIRTVSKLAKDSILNIVQVKIDKININPIYVDFEHEHELSWDENNNTILVVSRLEKEKNILLAIEIFKDVLTRVPNAKLRIVGGGSIYKEIEQKISAQNLESKIFLVGHTDDVLNEYKKAKVLLHTSNYEGFGMVFVEAGILGMPIVSTFVGIAPEITHTCFDKTDKRKAVEHLVYLLTDEPSWQRQSDYVIEKSKQFITKEEEYIDKIISNWNYLNNFR